MSTAARCAPPIVKVGTPRARSGASRDGERWGEMGRDGERWGGREGRAAEGEERRLERRVGDLPRAHDDRVDGEHVPARKKKSVRRGAHDYTAGGVCPSMMSVRVCACAGQTLLSSARGFPRGPKTDRRRRRRRRSPSHCTAVNPPNPPSPTPRYPNPPSPTPRTHTPIGCAQHQCSERCGWTRGMRRRPWLQRKPVVTAERSVASRAPVGVQAGARTRLLGARAALCRP